MAMDQHLLHKRIPPGFKIGEALAYLLFCAVWPLTLGTIYYLGDAFDSVKFVPLRTFIYLNATTVSTKIALMILVWWLFFKKLKSKSFFYKAKLHVVTGLLFSVLVVSISYLAYTYLLKAIYPKEAMLSDLYTHTVYYFFHISLFHGYNFYLDQKRQLLKTQQLQALAYESEIRALKSQIEPHFLFNTLNSISASIPPTMEQTRVMIAQLADTFRHALHTSNQRHIPLKEELQFIQTLLALEQQRFQERLQVEYYIDKACLQAQLPPMLLQPLIENALNHGIAPKIKGGTVCIHCKQEGPFVYIAVSDTGVGYAGELSQMVQKGIGLGNISRRLNLLYNESLQVERGEEGLRISFKIPFELAHEKKSYFN